MIQLDSFSRDLCQQLADMVNGNKGILESVLVSPEGFPMAASKGLDRDAVDRFAAVSAGLAAIAYGAAGRFGGGHVREIVVEMDHAFLLVTGVGDGASLGTVADINADLGQVGYDVAQAAQRLGTMVSEQLHAVGAASIQ